LAYKVLLVATVLEPQAVAAVDRQPQVVQVHLQLVVLAELELMSVLLLLEAHCLRLVAAVAVEA
jgi:hypothetical protein